jgi:hypothetical protein
VNQPTKSVTSSQPASTSTLPVTPLVNGASQSPQHSGMSGSSTTSRVRQDIGLVDSRPSNSIVPSPAQNLSSSHNPMSDRRLGTGSTQAVYSFLEQCTPSMGHLHQHFVNFGCSSEEYLVAVSGWPSEVVRKFLIQVLMDRETGEMLVNSMDMFVLQTHFLAYYQTYGTTSF